MEVAGLSVEERLRLMEVLWNSLCHDPVPEQGIPAWHQSVLEDRVTRLEAGKEPISSWEDAKQVLRDQIAARRCGFKSPARQQKTC
jgi:putative addiction module component (TIGR02574 family)